MEQNQNLFDLQITPESSHYLSETAKWSRFLSIIGFIFCGLLIVVAILGKVVTGATVFGKEKLNRLAIGVGMIPRGEVGLIFAQLGFSQGILNGELYAALLIVIALTTIAPPFLLKWFYGREADKAG